MSEILVIDDEEGIRKSLTAVLKDEDFSVDTAESGEEGLKKLKKKKYALILLDIWLPGIDGIETLEKIKANDPDTEVVVISGHGNVDTAVKTTKLGAYDFIEKPLDLEKTVIVVRNAIKHRALKMENRQLRENEVERFIMIGESIRMQNLKEQIKRAAPSEGRVLIFGENGTGKELAARMIHSFSERKDKPFVAVNCAAIPDELIESELFGHKKGAFTGAQNDKIGKFEQADNGTLFLDEIGDMSVKTQAKVLRVLEEEIIQPLGDLRSINVDVRVIAATNKDLEEEISEGNFRQDLYFRLNVIPIRMPPLRERIEDVPLLMDHYQEYFSSLYGVEKKKFTDDAMEYLKKYNWPGNVRELRNIIERIYIMVGVNKVSAQVITNLFMRKNTEIDNLYDIPDLREAMEIFEKKYIINKLELFEGNIGKTAQELGIERTSLYRKMKKYKINETGK